MKTSWQPVHKWYNESVGSEGHYYHQNVILPELLKKIDVKNGKILDLACGQGVFGRKVLGVYAGYDISPAFIKIAKGQDKIKGHTYSVQDVTKTFKTPELFTEAVIILALQNIDNIDAALKNAYQSLEKGGKLHLVLNHPCFRIPRQSSWGDDAEKKIQYRRIDKYLSPMEIPIHAHPGQGEKSASTLSYHLPLSAYIQALTNAGFLISGMEEWISNKESTGKNAKAENRARSEIPLFLYLQALK